MPKNTMDKKSFWLILRSVSIEMIVMALIFGGVGLGIGAFFDFKRVLCAGVGSFIGVMLALLSVWRRMKIYLGD